MYKLVSHQGRSCVIRRKYLYKKGSKDGELLEQNAWPQRQVCKVTFGVLLEGCLPHRYSTAAARVKIKAALEELLNFDYQHHFNVRLNRTNRLDIKS